MPLREFLEIPRKVSEILGTCSENCQSTVQNMAEQCLGRQTRVAEDVFKYIDSSLTEFAHMLIVVAFLSLTFLVFVS